MGWRDAIDMGEVAKAAQPELHKIAEKIADRASPRFRFTRHQVRSKMYVEDRPNGTVEVGLWAGGFEHLDEYGGSRSRPSGALRSAAAEAGRFTPHPKPS